MSKWLRTWVYLALCTAAAAQTDRDNVLILIADDLGVDGVRVYGEGAAPAPTPNIDGLAARGVLFRNAWADPVCSPSRACLHTGRHPHRTWVSNVGITAQLPPSEITLPEVLDQAGTGYRHALIGKWHLGQTYGGVRAPNVAGWSHYAGALGGSVNYFNWQLTVNGQTLPTQQYATTRTVNEAISWIGAQSQPWLCVVAFNAPHTPLHRPPQRLHTRTLPAGAPEVDPPRFFKAMVEAMDTEIGRLLAAPAIDLAQTNVIFVGDNGAGPWAVEPPFDPRHGKNTPYEGGLNVPLIVAGPAVRQQGREVAALVSMVDLFSTVTELAGADLDAVIPPWHEIDGVSLVPYLRDPEQAPLRDIVFSEYFDGTDWSTINDSGYVAVRDDRYKLIRRYARAPGEEVATRDELYDLVADPFETTDLLAGDLTAVIGARRDRLAAEIDRQRIPRGAIHVFGEPTCGGSAGDPAIGVHGSPAIGDTYHPVLRGAPPDAAAVHVVGTSVTTFGGVALPIDLQPFGAGAGCWLRTSIDVAIPVSVGPDGVAAVRIDVPAVTNLVSTVLFHTWLVPDAAANALGLTTSNAAAAVIGFEG